MKGQKENTKVTMIINISINLEIYSPFEIVVVDITHYTKFETKS